MSTIRLHRYKKEAIVDYHVIRMATGRIQSFLGNVVFNFTRDVNEELL